jgi:predicted nucleic acid-binding protein
MGWIRPHYLDTSTIIKLVLPEPGSNIIEAYFCANSTFHTTSICFAEALGVLKTKYFYRQEIDHDTYFKACDHLTSLVYESNIRIDEISINDIAVFDEVEKLSKRYSLDIADSFQIYTLKNSIYSRNIGESILITADKELAKAVRNEGLRAWDFLNENQP